MPQKYLLFGLVVICFTILLLTWMVRDSLCELQRRQGNIELVAFLACDINSKSIWWGSIPTMLAVSGILNAPFHCSPNKSFAS